MLLLLQDLLAIRPPQEARQNSREKAEWQQTEVYLGRHSQAETGKEEEGACRTDCCCHLKYFPTHKHDNNNINYLPNIHTHTHVSSSSFDVIELNAEASLILASRHCEQ
jgi:hypothetical protein